MKMPMPKVVAWLDALPVPVFLLIATSLACFVVGVLVFAVSCWKGQRLGLMTGAEMKRVGLVRAFGRVMIVFMSIPALLGAFLVYITLTSLLFDKFFGLRPEQSRLAGLYLPLIFTFVWAWAHREDKNRK